MRRVAIVTACLAAALLLAACQPPPPSRVASKKLEGEVAAMQTRVFAVSDKPKVLRAVVETLADMGYVVDHVNPDDGSVAASKGTWLDATAYVENQAADKTAVQLDIFVYQRNQWAMSQSDFEKLQQVDDSEFYQKFFFEPLSQKLGLPATAKES